MKKRLWPRNCPYELCSIAGTLKVYPNGDVCLQAAPIGYVANGNS
jgi:hypothetical protein